MPPWPQKLLRLRRKWRLHALLNAKRWKQWLKNAMLNGSGVKRKSVNFRLLGSCSSRKMLRKQSGLKPPKPQRRQKKRRSARNRKPGKLLMLQHLQQHLAQAQVVSPKRVPTQTAAHTVSLATSMTAGGATAVSDRLCRVLAVQQPRASERGNAKSKNGIRLLAANVQCATQTPLAPVPRYRRHRPHFVGSRRRTGKAATRSRRHRMAAVLKFVSRRSTSKVTTLHGSTLEWHLVEEEEGWGILRTNGTTAVRTAVPGVQLALTAAVATVAGRTGTATAVRSR